MSLECTACPDNILLSPFSIAGLLSGLSWFVYALCLISSWRTDMYPVCYESKLSFLFLFLSWHRKKYRYKIKEGFLRNRISDYSRNGIFRQPKNVLGSHSSRPQRYCWFFFLCGSVWCRKEKKKISSPWWTSCLSISFVFRMFPQEKSPHCRFIFGSLTNDKMALFWNVCIETQDLINGVIAA